MVDSTLPLVTVTGVSGYIGAQCTKLLLESGKYRVRGTVRNRKNEAKIAPIRESFGEHFDRLELVEADLLDEASMIKAVAGSDYLVHVASPFFMQEPKDENEIIKPAVDGTISALKAARLAKVKRVVLTSSIGAIFGANEDEIPEDKVFTEKNWTETNDGLVKGAYFRSKALAERAAWDYHNSIPEEERFEMVAINPGLVVGPSLCGKGFESGKFVEDIVLGRIPGYAPMILGMVDVRNVAEAHVRAIDAEGVQSRRMIVVSENLWMPEFGKLVHDEFAPQGYDFSLKETCYCLMKVLSYVSDEVYNMMPFWDKEIYYDTSPSKELLGIKYIPIKQSQSEMINQMIEKGWIPDKRPK